MDFIVKAARLLREYEGYIGSPYLCPNRVPTIGYGKVILKEMTFTSPNGTDISGKTILDFIKTQAYVTNTKLSLKVINEKLKIKFGILWDEVIARGYLMEEIKERFTAMLLNPKIGNVFGLSEKELEFFFQDEETIKKLAPKVVFKLSETEPQVEEIDIEKSQKRMNDNQIAAVISLEYNIGLNAFDDSTVLKELKADPDNKPKISAAFKMWKRSGNNPDLLLSRRIKEVSVYFS